jgi:phosphatidylserine synthase
MADAEQKREKGNSLMFAGLAVWVAGLLVLFYVPAGIRLGHQPGFAAILIVLVVLGAVLMIRGWSMHRRESSE